MLGLKLQFTQGTVEVCKLESCWIFIADKLNILTPSLRSSEILQNDVISLDK